ncbi:head-tail connector protein [Bacillus safensis]|uniref:head-tail connector protein n=1 Tax=Bacillus safensis TaxID=561879 RepID=UPI000A454555|nr:head-tail connector protein [Bacillus safensis]
MKGEYLKVDTDQDDALLKTLITAAKEYIKNGIGRYVEGNAQFELVVGMLVEHWYENRGCMSQVFPAQTSLLPFMLC